MIILQYFQWCWKFTYSSLLYVEKKMSELFINQSYVSKILGISPARDDYFWHLNLTQWKPILRSRKRQYIVAGVRGTHESICSKIDCCFLDIVELDWGKKFRLISTSFPLILRGNVSSYLVRQELKVVDKSTE